MRRSALGPVSHSAMNARSSSGQAAVRNPRASLAFKRSDDRRATAIPLANGRRSTANFSQPPRPSNSIRQSTAFGSGSRSLRQDPRPLTERPFIQRSVKSIMEFLMKHQYDAQISTKALTNPTTKDFIYVFLFLMHQIDPTFSFPKRFEDELPAVLRSLGYPFSISKSALSAIGSPHTWPALLGVLMWIVGLSTFADTCRKQEESRQLDHPARRATFFHSNMSKAYTQWLQGAESFPELDQEHSDFFKNENEGREVEISKWSADVEQCTAVHKSLTSQPSPLLLTKEHVQSIESSIGRFKIFLPSLSEHLTNVENRFKIADARFMQTKAEIDDFCQAKARLKPVLEEQEEQAIDIVVSDQEKIKETLARTQAERIQVESEQKQCEVMAADKHALLTTVLSKYNGNVEDYEMLWTGSDLPMQRGKSNLAISISRDASATEADQLVSMDIGKEALPEIERMKEMLSHGAPSLHENLLRLRDDAGETEEKMIMLRHEKSMAQGQNEKREAEYEQQKQELQKCLQYRSENVQQQDADYDDNALKKDDDLRQVDQKVNELLARKQMLQQRYDEIRQESREIMVKQISIGKKHVQQIRRCILGVKSHIENKTCELQSLPM